MINKISKSSLKKILKIDKNFLFIDKIIYLKKNKEIKSLYNLKKNFWFMKSHFINEPVMPGTLQLEAMLQTSAVLIYKSENKIFERSLITKIDTNFFNKIENSGILEIICKIIKSRNGIIIIRSEMNLNKKKTCQANFVYVNPEKFKI